ncbi:hypothetical protein H6F32_16705 [Anabaena sp. FACHB-1237]|uniref:hypothetical protein n=1 Tax=Anabaena sp. FACHB-1237 TaxID=2692769 RepID=UPI0016805EF9|nr:hypothetical protein [Anabaena sp. FACHB-1237]MBD2139173.1 hypothetical protein [Anabaena sp. FACHB-1237]
MEHLNDFLLGNLDLHLNVHISFLHNFAHINSITGDHTHFFMTGDYTSIKDPDLLGQIEKAWNTFVKSGQIWAIMIGIVVGYIFKSLSSFG